jgi:hypothetical protein
MVFASYAAATMDYHSHLREARSNDSHHREFQEFGGVPGQSPRFLNSSQATSYNAAGSLSRLACLRFGPGFCFLSRMPDCCSQWLINSVLPNGLPVWVASWR